MSNSHNKKKDGLSVLTEERKELFVKPFRSRFSKKPVTPGSRKHSGSWSGKLEDMGYKGFNIESATKEERSDIENHLRWSIAHNNYQLLLPCISINEDYDQAQERLYYEVDLHGSGKLVEHGHLFINSGDYLLFYMRMGEQKRKESILSRIALANVGLLTPYVLLERLLVDKLNSKLEVSYEFVL